MPGHCLVCWGRLRATEAANRRRPAQQSHCLEVSCGWVGAKITHANKPRRQTADPGAILSPLAVPLIGTSARTVADCRAGHDLARKKDRLDALPQTTRFPDAHQESDLESSRHRRRERCVIRVVRVQLVAAAAIFRPAAAAR